MEIVEQNLDNDRPESRNQDSLVSSSLDQSQLESMVGTHNIIYTITKWNYLLIMISITLYMSDILSDFILGIRYLWQEAPFHWIYGTLTLSFIIFPSLIINTILDYDGALWRKKKGNKWFQLWIVPYIVFNIEPVVLYVRNWKILRKYLKYKETLMFKEQAECWLKYTHGFCEAADKRDWEATLEAMPQLILQLYIVALNDNQLTLNITTALQLLALLTSIVGLTATCFTWYKADRVKRTIKVSMFGYLLYALGQSIPIGCRAVAVAVCMTLRPWWCLSILVCHWIVALLWWTYKYQTEAIRSAAHGLELILRIPTNTDHETVVGSCMWYIEEVCLMTLWFTACIGIRGELAIMCSILVIDAIFRIVYCLSTIFYYKFEILAV